MKRVSAAEAKSTLLTLMAEVSSKRSRVLIERRGRPVAALVTPADLERLETGYPSGDRARGALALSGAWRDLSNEQIDELIAEIYAGRQKDRGRPVDLSS